MKQRKTSAILTLILAHLILTFFAFTHVIGSLVVLATPSAGFAGFIEATVDTLTKLFIPNFSVIDELIGFIIAVGALAIALILVIVWVIRLLVHRRKCANLISPLLFLISVFIGVFLVSGHKIVEAGFSQANTHIATVYWFVIGVLIVALALHLVVVGLATSGPVKVASLLDEVDVDEYIEVNELVEKPVEEKPVEAAPAKEPVAEVVEEVAADEDDEIVVREEIIEPERERIISETTVVSEVDLTNEELHALIRKIANEEIAKRPATEKVVVREVVREEPKPVVKAEPKPEPKPVAAPRVIVEEKPIVKKAAVQVPPPAAKKKDTVERIPFPRRMQIVEKSVKADYNTLKSYLLSYGLNSRVSNVADSFRQGRVLFARLTNSGNSGLKLYLPLNMDDYKDSKIPLKSAAGLKQYEDVPVFLYIRSDLSMKRAKELIDDVMLKHGIARKDDVEDVDHVKQLVA